MKVRTLRSTCARLAVVCLLTLAASTYAGADTITLAWDAGSGVGYRVHVGVQSGSYTQHFDVGSTTLFNFSTAVAGQRYCFAVSAYFLSSLTEGPNSSELCGYSNAPPTLSNPGDRTSTVGQPVTLQLVGSDPESQPLTYSATGLPPGVSVQASTGFISGTGTTAGTYAVTARASDSVLSASQTFTWVMTAATGDTTRPTVSISSPAAGTTTTASTLDFSGSAADNVGVTQVTWSSDRGGSGPATGTTSWSVAGIPLATGTNVITITARDAAGNAATVPMTVTRSTSTSTVDTTSPTISITTPTSAATYTTTSSTITVGGSAADNVGVTRVEWFTDRGASGSATGTTNWTASVLLLSGSNVVTVRAFDAAGNRTAAMLTITYGTTSPPTTTPPPATVTLTVEPRKSTKWRSARLSWSTAPWPSVDVYRNGVRVTNTENDGFYTDPIWSRGTYTYKVCAPDSTTACSNTVTVYF